MPPLTVIIYLFIYLFIKLYGEKHQRSTGEYTSSLEVHCNYIGSHSLTFSNQLQFDKLKNVVVDWELWGAQEPQGQR